MARRPDKGRPIRPAWSPSRCCFPGLDTLGSTYPPHCSALAPHFLRLLQGGSLGLGHPCRPSWGLVSAALWPQQPPWAGGEVTPGVLALCSVLGVSPGPLFLPVLPKSLWRALGPVNKRQRCIVFMVCLVSAPARPSTWCWDSQIMVKAPGPRGSVRFLGSTRGCSGLLWEVEVGASWSTEAGVGLGSCGIWGAAHL